MSSERDTLSHDQEFSKLRGIFWPIYKFEVKKFLPMSIMMICILFNYTILRDTKDTLVINAPAGGAECLGFLKLYGVTPSAILFMILFFKLANAVKPEKLFYIILTPFLVFFAAFAFVIYPNKALLHMSLETIQYWQNVLPNLHWFMPIIGNWSFSLFYILSELWGSVVLAMLFWQFANQITRIHEAKRFYALFGMIGNLGLLLSGPTIIFSARYAKTHFTAPDSFGINLRVLMSAVVISGLIVIGIYRWMTLNVLTDIKLYNPEQKVEKKQEVKLSIIESFKYVLSNPYLLLIALLVLSYGVSINLVEGVWKGQIKLVFPDMNDYNAFMGRFSTWTGACTIILMLVGSNILRRVQWVYAALLTPVIILVTATIFFLVVWYYMQNPLATFMGFSMVMLAVFVGQIQNIFSKGVKYSLFDSTKNMTYIPLDREAKLKGQAAVEVIGGRAGKSGGAAIQSTLLAIISGNVTLASLTFILGPLVIFTCLVWMVAVILLNKRFTILSANKKPQTQQAPVLDLIANGVNAGNPGNTVIAANKG